jgi:hypothetical protein
VETAIMFLIIVYCLMNGDQRADGRDEEPLSRQDTRLWTARRSHTTSRCGHSQCRRHRRTKRNRESDQRRRGRRRS